jgi:hypothetical protein
MSMNINEGSHCLLFHFNLGRSGIHIGLRTICHSFQPNSPAGYIAFFLKSYVHMAEDLWVYTILKV